MMIFTLALAIHLSLASAQSIASQQAGLTHNLPSPFPAEYLELKRQAEAEVHRAKDLVQSGKYEEAKAMLIPAIERYDGVLHFQPLRRELSEIAIRQGRLEEAMRLLPREGAEMSDGRRYARIGFLEAAVGDYALSKAMWDKDGPVEYIKKKEDTHRMADANKAFAHFRF